MTTSRRNLMAQAILLYTKLCKNAQGLLSELRFERIASWYENTNFVTSLLRCNRLFLEWVQIIKYFKTHCKLLKCIIRGMLFPTKLTSLIYTLGLIESASLENRHNKRRNSGSHKWPKTFFGRCMGTLAASLLGFQVKPVVMCPFC